MRRRPVPLGLIGIEQTTFLKGGLLTLIRGRLVLGLLIDEMDDKHPVQRPFYSHSINRISEHFHVVLYFIRKTDVAIHCDT